MSSWGNRRAPSLADNAGLAHGLNARTANGGVVAKNMSLRSQNLPTSIATKISWWQMPGVICHRWQMYQERHEIVTKMHHLRSNFNFFLGGGPPDPHLDLPPLTHCTLCTAWCHAQLVIASPSFTIWHQKIRICHQCFTFGHPWNVWV